jgi:secernin
MGCDTVVALGRATVDGATLFGHNSAWPAREGHDLVRRPGRAYAFGEKVRLRFIELPQARETYTVLGAQPAGHWGYTHGVNEHGVAVGCSSLRTTLAGERTGLAGTDLVRLALERGRTAQQAVDQLTLLVERHGQGCLAAGSPQSDGDCALLLADAGEAYVLETAGHFWVCQDVHEVRAISDVSTVRQDWDRISPGLASHGIAQGWWPADGHKVDFAGGVAADPVGSWSALRRWGRATLLLEQQNGHVDAAFLRRLLADHYEGMHAASESRPAAGGPVPLCQHGDAPASPITAASMVVHVGSPDRLLVAWCAFGPPCSSVYFPLFLDGEPPAALGPGSDESLAESPGRRFRRSHEELRIQVGQREVARDTLSRLQARFDQEAEEFAAEGATLKKRGALAELQRLAAIFMQHNLERFEEAVSGLAEAAAPLAASAR